MKKTILSTLMIAMFGFSTVALAQNAQNPVVQEQQQEKEQELEHELEQEHGQELELEKEHEWKWN